MVETEIQGLISGFKLLTASLEGKSWKERIYDNDGSMSLFLMCMYIKCIPIFNFRIDFFLDASIQECYVFCYSDFFFSSGRFFEMFSFWSKSLVFYYIGIFFTLPKIRGLPLMKWSRQKTSKFAIFLEKENTHIFFLFSFCETLILSFHECR